jgi:hypothetical protein
MQQVLRHSTIQFGNRTITKRTAPDLMKVEVEKARQGYEIGKECGLFRVPKVLDYDETKGIAVFERIEQIQPIHNVIFKANQIKPILEMAGRSLAIIHQKLTLPRKMTIALPPEIDSPETKVFLHGDFNGYNVCFEKHSSKIIVLDWQTTVLHGGCATYGSRYFDLIWFVDYILWNPTLRYIWGDPVNPLIKVFIKSYFEEAGILDHTERFSQYAKNFFKTKQPFRRELAAGRIRRFMLSHSYTLTRRFMKSLDAMISC